MDFNRRLPPEPEEDANNDFKELVGAYKDLRRLDNFRFAVMCTFFAVIIVSLLIFIYVAFLQPTRAYMQQDFKNQTQTQTINRELPSESSSTQPESKSAE